MPARPLTEAVQQAEQAMSGGDYHLAVETCQRVLGQFPEFATAHQILAGAYLEQGDEVSAERELYETLRRDPQSSAAFAGLGRIAESRGDLQSALAYVQAAWEIEPQRADLREWVSRISERQYGPGGRLHLTRAALASMHFQAGRWSRAAAESAVVLAEHPSRIDVQLRLAESLWRRGDDAGAAAAAREVLDAAPAAVKALLMLADIERRQGNEDSAVALLDRARAIDPDGVHAADLIAVGSDDLAEFLLPSEMPLIEETPQATLEIERPRIAPAPDFTSAAPPAAPAAPREFAPPAAQPDIAAEASFSLDFSLPDDREIEAARPPSAPVAGYGEVFETLQEQGVAPFSFGDETQSPLDAAESSTTELEDLFSLSSDEDLQAAIPSDERPRGYTGILNSLDDLGLQPFTVEGQPSSQQAPTYTPAEPPSPPAPPVEEASPPPPLMMIEDAPAQEQVDDQAGEARAELTADWDTIDQEIQRATPQGIPSGFTAEFRRLDNEGLEPFFIEGASTSWETGDLASGTDSAASDLHAQPEQGLDATAAGSTEAQPPERSWLDDLHLTEPETPTAAAQPSGSVHDFGSLQEDLTTDWGTVDQEIQQAIPAEFERGYTDELKLIGESGLEPFSIDAAPSPELPGVDTDDDLFADLDLSDIVLDMDEELEFAADATSAQEDSGLSEEDLLVFGDIEADDLFASEAPAEQTPVEQATPEPRPWPFGGDFASVEAEPEPASKLPPPAAPAPRVDTTWGSLPIPEPGQPAWQATRPLEPLQEHPVAEHPIVVPDLDALRSTIARLGVDAALLDRSRQGKQELVQAGRIQGDTRLPGDEPEETGPSIDDLEAALAADPDDAQARLQLASALSDTGEIGRALEHYRVVFHRQRDLGEELIAGVSRIAEQRSGGAPNAHRLLGALYRRAGNLALSAKHYEHSLDAYRRA